MAETFELGLSSAASSLAKLRAADGNGAISVREPFSQPILLVEDAVVAGRTHVEGVAVSDGGVSVGNELRFVREAGNRFDRWSIRVDAPSGERLGYVPCDCNEIVARLMDGGKRVYGVVSQVGGRSSWARVVMEVYLDD